LRLFLHSLPLGCKFNVVSFGSNHVKVFKKSFEYNQNTLDAVVATLKHFDADMGGTEILSPIKDIFNDSVDPTFPRHLYLLTDGAVNNTD
jgi:hypothetical protein